MTNFVLGIFVGVVGVFAVVLYGMGGASEMGKNEWEE